MDPRDGGTRRLIALPMVRVLERRSGGDRFHFHVLVGGVLQPDGALGSAVGAAWRSSVFSLKVRSASLLSPFGSHLARVQQGQYLRFKARRSQEGVLSSEMKPIVSDSPSNSLLHRCVRCLVFRWQNGSKTVSHLPLQHSGWEH